VIPHKSANKRRPEIDYYRIVKFRVIDEALSQNYLARMKKCIEKEKIIQQLAQFDWRYKQIADLVSRCLSNPRIVRSMPRLRMTGNFSKSELKTKLVEIYHLNMKFIVDTNSLDKIDANKEFLREMQMHEEDDANNRRISIIMVDELPKLEEIELDHKFITSRQLLH